MCWYSHNTESKDDSDTEETIKCRYCEKVLKSKSELMKHRKLEHSQIVIACRNIANGYCRFSSDECWYSHADIAQNKSIDSGKQDFRKDLKTLQPPDLIQRMICLMETMLEKTQIA